MSKIHLNDKVEISTRKVLDNGFLRVRGKIARTGIQEYTGHELGFKDSRAHQTFKLYRPPEEVFKPESMGSFANKSLTDDHPGQMVTPANARQFSVGWSGDSVIQVGNLLECDLTFSDQGAIDKMNAGKVELSNGYDMTLDMTPGKTPEGLAYDGVQRDIVGNHIALVEFGRCGTECRVGDAVIIDCGCDACKAKAQGDVKVADIKTRTVTVDGISIETTDQGAQVIDRLQGQLRELETKLGTADANLAAEKTAHVKTVETKDGEIAGLKAKLPTADTLDAMVAARSVVIGDCLKVLGKDYDVKGKTDAELRRAAVAKRMGDAAVKDRSDDYVSAAFDAIILTVSTDRQVDPVRDHFLRQDPAKPSLTQDQQVDERSKWISDQSQAWLPPSQRAAG